jgi:hypothetical protein
LIIFRHRTAGARSLSRATEDSLTWSLVLLGSSVGGLSPDVLAPLVPRLEQLVDDALKVRCCVALVTKGLICLVWFDQSFELLCCCCVVCWWVCKGA